MQPLVTLPFAPAEEWREAGSLCFSENGLAARILHNERMADMIACQRLRYDYFVRRRGWIADDAEMAGLETDAYDAHALHLAVFSSGDITAYLRVLPYAPEIGFMLNHEFACLLNGKEPHRLSCDGAVELSRLVYQPLSRSLVPTGQHPLELLLKLLYRVSLAQGFTRFYIVVEESWIRPFARRFGLAFTPIGTPYVFPDGTRTVAATATLAELQDSMRKHSQAKFDWYHQ